MNRNAIAIIIVIGYGVALLILDNCDSIISRVQSCISKYKMIVLWIVVMSLVLTLPCIVYAIFKFLSKGL